MKKTTLILIILVGFIASCTKNKNGGNNTSPGSDSINRVWVNQKDYTISAAEYANAGALFQQNNLKFSSLRWWETYKETSVLDGAEYYTTYADQYLNGLRIINGRLIHQFKNKQFYLLKGNEISSTVLDTIPGLALAQVRKLFAHELLTQKSSIDLVHYNNDCIKAEFGYYNLNWDITIQPVNLIKIWRVYPETNKNVFAYIKDDGTVMAFTDGVIIPW